MNKGDFHTLFRASTVQTNDTARREGTVVELGKAKRFKVLLDIIVFGEAV